MNKSRWLLGTLAGAVLVFSTFWITDNKVEKRHKQEYSTHVSNALTDMKLADQGVRDLLTGWGNVSQLDVSNSLLYMSHSLKAAEVETNSLQGYLTYHDDTNSGPSTSFLSDLCRYYRESIDTRLRGSWQMKKGDANWNALEQDLKVLGEDFHHLAQADPSEFEKNSLSGLHQYWLGYTSTLKFQEVTKRYNRQ